jgi:hypothetical protein
MMHCFTTYGWICLLVVLGINTSDAWGVHPFHASVGEVEFDAQSKKLEVAIRLSPVDFEQALSSHFKEKIDLEKTDVIDQRITDYLQASFIWKNQADEPYKIVWVGKELDAKYLWIYFEIPVSDKAGLEKSTLSNRICFENEREQTNTLVLRSGEKRATLRCTPQHPSQKVSFANDGQASREK